MTVTFTIPASKSLRSRYKRLLISEWNSSAFDEVLVLLGDELGKPGGKLSSLREILKPARGKISGGAINIVVVERIREFRSYFQNEPIPAVPHTFSAASNIRITQAESTWTFLVLQALAKVSGDIGLFADTQSLLFFLALEHLLPHLKEHEFLQEHDCLLNALFMHAHTTGLNDPAHHFYMVSEIAGYLGQSRWRQSNLERAFRLTPADDHSYLTKAQAFWQSLTDEGHFEEAQSFLLDVLRSSPPEQVPEIKDMIAQSLQLATANSR